MADRGCGGRGRRDHRRGIRRAGSGHRRIDRINGAAIPVRDAAASGGAAADCGEFRRGSTRAGFRCGAPRGSLAAGLLGAGAVAARGQCAGRAGAVAACAGLSGGQARRLAGAGDRRYRDAGGAAGDRPAGEFSHDHRAGPGAADQAEGLELRAAVRPRRVRRGVRRRGPAGARPAAPGAGGVSRRRAQPRCACRPSSTSTTPIAAG